MNNVQEESLREQKKSKRRALTLEIARDIIASKGLRLLKVRDVAEAADCSIGSIYNEFGDFDGLILAVNRETVQALTARLTAVPADDPERLRGGVRVPAGVCGSDPGGPRHGRGRAGPGHRGRPAAGGGGVGRGVPGAGV